MRWALGPEEGLAGQSRLGVDPEPQQWSLAWQVPRLPVGHSDPLDPLGAKRRPLVSQVGQGGGGSHRDWVQTALGVAGHRSCDTEPWGNQNSAVPAVPSLERCAPLDRTQLLKEPPGPSLRWRRLAMDPVGYLHPSVKEPGPGGWRAPGPELAHHKQNKQMPSMPELKQIMSLLPSAIRNTSL